MSSESAGRVQVGRGGEGAGAGAALAAGLMPLVRGAGGVGVRTPGGLLALRNVLGIGQNYARHAREMGSTPPERPVVFVKNAMCLALDAEAIVIPPICAEPPQVDFEGELVVVLGRAARDVPEGRALEWVLGYAAGNDVSARWWQKQGSGGQFWRGKSFDTFGPMSAVAPAAGVGDPQGLTIRTRVNGEVMQESGTSDMIFPVATLISELSRGTTLPAGTAIFTGTPSGVGTGRTPPVYLKPGDEVEVSLRSGGGVELARVSNGVRAG